MPWNEVVVLDSVKLSNKGSHSSSSGISTGIGIVGGGVLVPDILAPRKFCPDHDYDTMKPLVLATWKHNFQVNGQTSRIEKSFICKGYLSHLIKYAICCHKYLGPSTRSQCYTGRISSRPRESRACKWNELGISLRQDQRLFVNDSASTYAF